MKKLLLLLLLIISFTPLDSQALSLERFLDRKEMQRKIRDKIAEQDINFDISLGDIDLMEGINIAGEYHYEVEASYINKFYSRVDKWDVRAKINIGDVIKDLIDSPFGFTVNRDTSFYFVRQFPSKKEAIKATPYGPQKLPLNAKLALANLNPGDFVSMPVNLSVALGVSDAQEVNTQVLLKGSASAAVVLSGEFTVQVYKLDATHVRLKLLTTRGNGAFANFEVRNGFNIFGLRAVDHQIERLFDRDLIELGFKYDPGSQFIIDYVFDLKNAEAQEAYNQILSSTLKFKDFIVADMVDAKDLKDKLISTYEKTDALFFADQNKEPKDRRVQRIFKGFSSYKGHTRHIKLGLLVTSYAKDLTYTESKVTFIDKNEKNFEFFYPTYSKYIETHLGRRLFDLKDQVFQNNFGLIPRFQSENTANKNPDLGLTFERKDRHLTNYEQRHIENFMLTEIPKELVKDIDFSEWKSGSKKYDTRIFFQLVLKDEAFHYLKNFDAEELKKKILIYMEEKKNLHVIDRSKSTSFVEKTKNYFLIDRYVEKKKLTLLASSLAKILSNKENNSEEMLKKLVALNELGVFDKMGIGFLISLLPQEKLSELAYLKLEMIGKDLRPINHEFGTLKYRALYKELTEVQSRLSNRSYDLRLSDQDRNVQDLDTSTF